MPGVDSRIGEACNPWREASRGSSTGIKAFKDLGFDVVGLSDQLEEIGKAKG